MTRPSPRPTASTISDDQLDALYADLRQARASLAGTGARLRQVSGERDSGRRWAVALEQELAALHQGEEPPAEHAVSATAGQWLWRWNRATPEERLAAAAAVLADTDALGRVRAAAHIADAEDVTDWQRGYRACANRVTAALEPPDAVVQITLDSTAFLDACRAADHTKQLPVMSVPQSLIDDAADWQRYVAAHETPATAPPEAATGPHGAPQASGDTEDATTPERPPSARTDVQHDYLSTGCLHGNHGYCQSHTGLSGNKQPASCKFCHAPCQCTCHNTPED